MKTALLTGASCRLAAIITPALGEKDRAVAVSDYAKNPKNARH